jgi:hypothetical protein
MSFLYYFFKYKNIYTFFFSVFNNFFKLKLLVFFKRKNMLFHKRANFKKIAYNKVVHVPKLKRRFERFKQKTNRTVDNNSRFLSTVSANRDVIKSIFFRKHTRQKNITKFLVNLSKKNNHLIGRMSNFLSFVLVQSHFFFFISDANHFIKKKLVYVNGRTVLNKFFEVKINDRIGLVTFNSYFDYIYSIFKYFKKKKAKIKYRRWRNYQERLKGPVEYKPWLPNFLNKFLFYKIDIPKYLEVDFFSLTVVYIYMDNDPSNKNKFFLKFISFYMIRTYNWKKLN